MISESNTTVTIEEKENAEIITIKPVNQDAKNLKLNIFDFDGTLFKSPEPNPAIWHQHMIGKLKAMSSEPGGLGWFQETLTLDHPYVPMAPSSEWFNTQVLEDALKSASDNDTVTILLTGRTTLYKDIINRILASVNLEMNHIGLKPTRQADVVGEATFEFKMSYIKKLVSQYNGRIKHINIYEDRKKHADRFKTDLAKLPGITSEVYLISEPPKYLSDASEKELVERLVAKNGTPEYRMQKVPSYTCALLDDQSHSLIKSWFNFPDEWEIKCHHATMNLGAHNPTVWKFEEPQAPEKLSANYAIGTQLKLQVEAIGLSGAAIALKVSGVPSQNNLVHITLAHHPKAKPVDSNFIKNWTPIDEIQNDEHILEFLAQAVVNSPDTTTSTTTSTTTTTTTTTASSKAPTKDGAKKPPAKQSFDYPSVSVKAKINKLNLTLTATITEVGPITYELVDPKSQKKNTTTANKGQKGVNLGELVKKHLPEEQNIGKVIGKIKEQLNKDDINDLEKVEECIKKLSLN